MSPCKDCLCIIKKGHRIRMTIFPSGGTSAICSWVKKRVEEPIHARQYADSFREANDNTSKL